MPKFAAHFGINKRQAQLDFVNVNTERDMPLFVDPYVFVQRTDVWSIECNEAISSFFDAVLEAIRTKDDSKALRLLNHLKEPNETCLGLSQGIPSGRGVSGMQASKLLENLKRSKAAKTGL